MEVVTSYFPSRFTMSLIEKLYNLEAALIDIKMYVAFFKVRCYQAPHFCFRISFFQALPYLKPETFAMLVWV